MPAFPSRATGTGTDVDSLLLLKAVLLGLIEGLTEFLPISSTGHLILASRWLEFNRPEAKTFEVVIQLGAILAVCWEYRRRFIDTLCRWQVPDSRRLMLNVVLGCLPAAALGALCHDFIKTVLFQPGVVATALIAGGIAILLIERRAQPVVATDIGQISPRLALAIGCIQALALVPGVSRSGATILGGVALGLGRRAATEFSFFLAVPIMFAASGLEVLKSGPALDGSAWWTIVPGFVVAFLSALLAIRFLIRFVSNHSFEVFAWYRIALGLAVLLVLGWSADA